MTTAAIVCNHVIAAVAASQMLTFLIWPPVLRLPHSLTGFSPVSGFAAHGCGSKFADLPVSPQFLAQPFKQRAL
ncbi:MAG TPA: hypothetical protein VMW23_06760 [Sedimentisphaerales bacterium]|nr:hypothetical protein [Sedimentisphaerales bacterium]